MRILASIVSLSIAVFVGAVTFMVENEPNVAIKHLEAWLELIGVDFTRWMASTALTYTLSIFFIVLAVITYLWPVIGRELFMPNNKDNNTGNGFTQKIGTNYGQAAQTINNNFEDRSVKRRLSELFKEIDPRVNGMTGSVEVRMEPSHFQRLQGLIGEGGPESPIQNAHLVSEILGSHINNGSLGITYAAEMQYIVQMDISAILRDR